MVMHELLRSRAPCSSSNDPGATTRYRRRQTVRDDTSLLDGVVGAGVSSSQCDVYRSWRRD